MENEILLRYTIDRPFQRNIDQCRLYVSYVFHPIGCGLFEGLFVEQVMECNGFIIYLEIYKIYIMLKN